MDFYGPFKNIMNAADIEVGDLYEGIPSKIINYFNYDYNEFEPELYLKYYNLCKGNILELGCGSGRLTLVLAEHGANIIGIDNSTTMLELFEQNVNNSLHKELLKARVKILNQDIFEYDLADSFSMAILPSTTISILALNYEKLINTMIRIYNDLPENGLFIFDYLILMNYKEEILSNVINIQGVDYKNTFSNFVDKNNKLIIFNMLTENLNSGKKYLSSSLKRLMDTSNVYELINKTGFSIKDEIDFMVNETMCQRYVVLAK